MRCAVWIGLTLACLMSSARADSQTCPASRCLDIELVAVDAGDGPARDRRWLDAQVQHANRLFSDLDTGFRIATRRVVTGPARIRTRRQRDALGRHERDAGAITVFLVRDLDDVDVEGRSLRGVHWRRRSDRSETWIILSSLDDTGAVLAHELGHYFGLPHSRAKRSVMNKSPHEDPPFVERVFTPPEVDALRAGVRERFPNLEARRDAKR